MHNRQKIVFGVFRSKVTMEEFFNALLYRGYLSSDVNLMMTDRTRRRDYVWNDFDRTSTTDDGEVIDDRASVDFERSGGISSAVCTTLAEIASTGVKVSLPNFEVIIAGPIMSALTCEDTGTSSAGFVEELVAMGIAEQDAKAFKRAIEDGKTVVSVAVRVEDTLEIEKLMIACLSEYVSCCYL